MVPGFRKSVPVEDPEDSADDEQHDFVERTWDRQEAESGSPPNGPWDAAVADHEGDGADGSNQEVARAAHPVSLPCARPRSHGCGRGLDFDVMLDRLNARMLPIANRASEHAPMVAVCCNACRTCTTTNLIALGSAVAVGVVALVGRSIKRLISVS